MLMNVIFVPWWCRYEELLESRRKVQKQINDIGERWIKFSEEEKRDVKEDVVKRRKMHYNSVLLDMFRLEGNLAKKQDYAELEKLVKEAEKEERSMLEMHRKGISESEKRAFQHIDRQIRQTFQAQRDKLFSRIRSVAVDNAERELKIDRRVSVYSVVMQFANFSRG